MSTTHCTQCGKPFEGPACGPTHATIAVERLHLKQTEGDPEACDIARAVFPLRVHSSGGSSWHNDWEMSDGTIQTLNTREARVMQQNRISALLDHVYPDTDIDRELEEAELLSRCYSLPYSIEEIGAAFIAVHKNPTSKINAIVQTKRALNTGDLKKAKEIVDAVVEKIGAYPERVFVCGECRVGHGHAEWCSQHTRGTDTGDVLKDPWNPQHSTPWKNHGQRGNTNFLAQAQNTPPMGPDAVIHIEGEPIGKQRYVDEEAKVKKARTVWTGNSPLDALTQRAVNDFLGKGAHRTHALRGFLRFLAQEDLMTVLAESVVLIDDEHLLQAVKMLGPDEVESLNWAALEEIRTRDLDTGGLRGFPLRPLTIEEQETGIGCRTIDTQSGIVLEKDVQLAVGRLEEHRPSFTYMEEWFVEDLERDTGWNSVYAGAVADEAWKRYYREPEDTSEPDNPGSDSGPNETADETTDENPNEIHESTDK